MRAEIGVEALHKPMIAARLPRILPPHEPQGRARLSPARRAADAKWKRRARDRRALPLLGSGVQCANLSGNSLPKGEGRGGGKLDVEPPSIVLLMTGVRTAGTLAVLLVLFLIAPFCGS